MQICMKLNENDAIALGLRLSAARRARNWSIAELSRASGVEASQVSKVCAGKFRFINASVMQICITLGAMPEAVPALPATDLVLVDDLAAAWAAARPNAVLLGDLLDRLAGLRG